MSGPAKTAFQSQYARHLFNLRGYNKYGLKMGDLLRETPAVVEAVRRLPKQVQDERNFRMLRAIQAKINHQILPAEQWTKFEEDSDYLEPILEEVIREMKEKEEWYKTH